MVFYDQFLELEQQKALARVWGSLGPLPALKVLGMNDPAEIFDGMMVPTESRAKYREKWHTDSSFSSQLPHAAVLRPEVISPVGGDTCWSSMRAAYDALSPTMQAWLEGLRAVHMPSPGYRVAADMDNRRLEPEPSPTPPNQA